MDRTPHASPHASPTVYSRRWRICRKRIDASSLGKALAALAARMEPKEAARVADRLAKALENPQEPAPDSLSAQATRGSVGSWRRKDADRLSSLGLRAGSKRRARRGDWPGLERLSAWATRWQGRRGRTPHASPIASPRRWRNLQETDSSHLASLGWALGGLSRLVPFARQTQLAALSNMLLKEVSGLQEQGEEEPEKRKQLADLYALLGAQDLAEVLKWPFCVGEAEKIALAELEKKTGRIRRRYLEVRRAGAVHSASKTSTPRRNVRRWQMR